MNEPKYLSYAYLELFKIIEGFFNQPDLFYEESGNVYTLVNDEKCLVAYKIKEGIYESNYGYSDKVYSYDIGINKIIKKNNHLKATLEPIRACNMNKDKLAFLDNYF